jgi:CBS domain containing-hemolysin-like protein
VSDGAAVTVAVLLLAANAYFVAAEFALVSARRTAIEPRAEAGSRAARVTLRAMERVSLMMAAAQLGITVCSLGLGALGEPAIAHQLEPLFELVGLPEGLLHPVAFVLALGIVTVLHVVVGEMVPKNLTLAAADRAALLLAPPLVMLVVALKPVIVAFNAVANAVLRLVRVEPRDEVTSAFTREEVADLVSQSRAEGLLDRPGSRLLDDALAFAERTVEAVLLPADRLVTVAPGATVRQVEDLVNDTGFSRFPVRTGAGLTGYLHVKDLLDAPAGDLDRPVPADRVRPLVELPAGTTLRAAVNTLRSGGAHLAQVHDGPRLLGVVALEDVLEELVGEIRDATRR